MIMKKILCILLITILTVLTVVLSGCNEEKKDNPETKATETTSQTEETKPKKAKKNYDIQGYLDSFVKGDSDFYGTWQPETFSYMNVMFRNDNLAEMITGSEGYFSEYGIDEKNKTVKLQLMPNVIDGEYNYEFSDDKQKLTLTSDSTEYVFVKQNDFTMVPEPPEKPMIDSDILGWWENKDGLFYCFQKDGLMYENNISMETVYTYTHQDNKIVATYSIGSDMTDEFIYSFKNGELTLDGEKCTKKEMD